MDTPTQERGKVNAAESRNGDRRSPRPAARRPASFGVMDLVWLLPRLLLRLFFPKLVDRYVLGEMLAPLVFGWTLFIVLFVFSVYLLKLSQFLARGAPLPLVAEMLWLRVVMSSVYCLPMAALLSGLLAFGRLSGDSELVATQASGIPNLRIVRNAFLIGLALSFAGLAINEYVIPPAGRRFHALEEKVKTIVLGRVLEDLAEQKAKILTDYEDKKLARLVTAKRYDPPRAGLPAMLWDVSYIEYRNDRIQMVVEADRAEYVGPDNERRGMKQWRFINADIQLMAEITGSHRWITRSRDWSIWMNSTDQEASQKLRDPDEMSYRELRGYLGQLRIERTKGRVLRELRVAMEQKLAIPFAALVLAMIGAPLGIRRQRSTTGVGIGLSVLIILLYYIGMSLLSVMGQNGKIGAREAAWGCNVVGMLAGLYLTWRSSR